jgi:hypothetical protein
MYMAPEIRRGFPYDPERAEIFNIGVYLFILMFQTVPFQAADYSDRYFRYVM